MNIHPILLLAGLLPLSANAGLLALWKLDSSPADELQNFPATWEGTAAYTTAVQPANSSAAAVLNGSQWLNGGSNLALERNMAFSASAWIKGNPQDSAILGDMDHGTGRKGWEFHVGSTENGAPGNSLTFSLNNDFPAFAIQVNANVNVLDGQWHHVAFTYDGSSRAVGVRIYVDGALATTTAPLDSLVADIASNGTARFNIGSRSQGAACNFNGGIDEVALFNHALTQVEITTMRQSGAESISTPFLEDTIPLPRQNVTTLSSAEVLFSYPVTGVGAWDLLVNGIRTSSVTAIDSKRYRFQFETPPQGDVNFSWAPGHGITGTHGIAAEPSDWSVLLVPTLPPAQLIISEFLTRNVGGLEDEDHDTPDWIELHNPGSSDVDLADWALTDDLAQPRRWKLPSAILRPGEYRIVFASGKNRRNAAENLHTDFKLSQNGGYLALTDPSGAVFHAYAGYPQQEGNVSFGLSGTAPSQGRVRWSYFPPTPGTENSSTPASSAAISETSFSPALPNPGEPISVALRMSPETVLTTTPALYYRVMQTGEKKLDFFDDGLHGDVAAGDGLWGAVIPGTATAGQMVRWRVQVTSTTAGNSYWPILRTNIGGNTSLPYYEGTVVSGGAGSTLMPVYQLFGDTQPSADTKAGGRYAFFAGGKLYDNVFVRSKGTTSLNLAKHSHRIDFNPGREFEWSDDLPPQRELNLNAEYLDPSYLRQNMQLWMHRDSGNSGAPHFPVKLTLNGSNWKLAFHTYSADSELLETMGLDPKGALYKQVWTLSNSQGEKKTRRWENYTDLAQLAAGISASSPADSRSRFIYDNLHLPAVINYLAVARIAQECDDVWANMTVYRDSEGTKEWRIIPFDVNLSFGQLYYGDSPSTNGGVQATNDGNKSHPLYGSSACGTTTYRVGYYNRLYNAVIQTPATRAMLLRRIRTLMDRYLATNAASSPLETRFDAIGAQINAEAVVDRSRWGWPNGADPYGFSGNISAAQGLATLKTSFLAPRRTHFYTTHSVQNTTKPIGIGNNDNAGIPNTQVATPVIQFGTIESQPVSGNSDEEYIELVNPGPDAVDMSAWVLRGVTGSFKFEAGTVIPAGNRIFVSRDVVAFRARTVSPKANENRHVVGPFSGYLSAYGDSLRLETETGTLIAQIQVPADSQATPIALVITEIMSGSNHGSSAANGDWWELTNNAIHPLDLTGFSWDDNRDTPFQAVFPPCMLGPGESLIVLDEDDPTAFRTAWDLPPSVNILTRADFGISSFRGLGTNDSVILYQPNGNQAARADYPSQTAGRSRAWLRSGAQVAGGFSEAGQEFVRLSTISAYDLGSPGSASGDSSVSSTPYGAWTSAHDLWTGSALPDADPDGDGRSNRAEYIFGGSPRIKDSPSATLTRGAGGGFEWTFMRRADDPTIVIELESCQNLKSWSPLTLPLLRTTPHPGLAGYEDVTYAVVPSGSKRFFRAKAN